MESKKQDFVENNPYLVYSPDADVSYTGGDSPTPPEPPTPVGSDGTAYILVEDSVQSTILNYYDLPINAESLEDGTVIDASNIKKLTVADGTIIEIKYEAGKIICIDFSDTVAGWAGFNGELGYTPMEFAVYDAHGIAFTMPSVSFDPIDMDDTTLTISDIMAAIADNTHPIPYIEIYME